MTTLSEQELEAMDSDRRRCVQEIEGKKIEGPALLLLIHGVHTSGFQAGLAHNRARVEEHQTAKELLTALRPFAALWLDAYDRKPDNHPVWGSGENVITVGDVKAARTAIARARGEG